MLKKLLVSSVIAGVMAFGIPTAPVFAQQTTAEQDAKKAKEEAKKAGKEAGAATKDAAKATGKTVKKGAKKTGQVTKDAAKETATGTKKAAQKTKDAVTPDMTSARCKDGTTQTGHTKTTACANHGGVADPQ
jgi:biopolymer transport protein ExbB/TolQ